MGLFDDHVWNIIADRRERDRELLALKLDEVKRDQRRKFLLSLVPLVIQGLGKR